MYSITSRKVPENNRIPTGKQQNNAIYESHLVENGTGQDNHRIDTAIRHNDVYDNKSINQWISENADPV